MPDWETQWDSEHELASVQLSLMNIWRSVTTHATRAVLNHGLYDLVSYDLLDFPAHPLNFYPTLSPVDCPPSVHMPTICHEHKPKCLHRSLKEQCLKSSVCIKRPLVFTDRAVSGYSMVQHKTGSITHSLKVPHVWFSAKITVTTAARPCAVLSPCCFHSHLECRVVKMLPQVTMFAEQRVQLYIDRRDLKHCRRQVIWPNYTGRGC